MSVRSIRSFKSLDGKHRLTIDERDDGHYRFVELVEHEHPYGLGTYWAPQFFSGIYDSIDAAERDARSMIAWLRQ